MRRRMHAIAMHACGHVCGVNVFQVAVLRLLHGQSRLSLPPPPSLSAPPPLVRTSPRNALPCACVRRGFYSQAVHSDHSMCHAPHPLLAARVFVFREEWELCRAEANKHERLIGQLMRVLWVAG